MTVRRYEEGDVLLVRGHASGKWGACVLARAVGRRNQTRKYLGFLFGPLNERPQSGDLVGFDPRNASLVIMMAEGDPNGFELVGRIASFTRAQWPVPAFGTVSPFGDRAWVTRYSDDLKELGSEVCPIEAASNLPVEEFSWVSHLPHKLDRVASGESERTRFSEAVSKKVAAALQTLHTQHSASNRPAPGPDAGAHALIVEFRYGREDLSALEALENGLQRAFAPGAGKVDGHQVAADLSSGSVFAYGPDADELWRAAEPTLRAATFTQGATVRLRYGPPEEDVREVVFRLD